MTGLPDRSIAALREGCRSGRWTPTALVQAVLAAADAYPDPAVWIARTPPAAMLARAAALEADPAARDLPLYGVPFAVKDNIDAAGFPTTAGCPAFSYRPARDSEVVRCLLAAGAILVGKTNLDQFATGLVGTRSPHGAPRCVFDADYISGGSSSGSAVAVAAGLVAFALGTDTAGSGRVPAGFNNIVGLKPTRGLVSLAGVVPACRTLDCVSLFANSASDAAIVLDVLAYEDPDDPYSRPQRHVALPRAAFRFGVLADADREFCGDAEAAALYDAAVDRLTVIGGTIVAIDYGPFREVASLLYDGPFVAERLAAIEDFVGAQAEAMDPTVRGIIEGARRFSAADAFRGLYRLQALARQASVQWRGFDVMLLPTSPTIFTVAALEAEPLRLNSLLGLYTNFVNLLDYAAIAVPAGFRTGGLPAGVTLVGPAFTDRDLAALAAQLHAAAGCGCGTDRDATLPAQERPGPQADTAPDTVLLAVAGAHLSGMALNHQLVGLGGRLVETVRTAPDYRLLALDGTVPPKPGLARTPGFHGPGIEVELWALAHGAFGRFVALVPEPMGFGKVTLSDGRVVPGFLCEAYALQQATDITAHGGWRAYRASQG